MPVHVRPVQSRKDLKKFIRLPWRLYQNDPAWVPPLVQERKQLLNRKKNPFFEHAEAEYFLAERNGDVVGRISAHIDHLHNQIHNEATGFFGFFESVDDSEVADKLFDTAATWIRDREMTHIRGPFSFSINEEAGLLVDGFEHSPFIMTGHNPRYYAPLLETWGLKKAKDLYCWSYQSPDPIPDLAVQIADEVCKQPGLVVRQVSPKTLEKDVRIILDVFNEAWQHNWGFVPLTENEVRKAAKDFKMILEPKMALIAEVDGKPAAISLALPNLNEAIRDLNGRLFPLGIFKLLYRMKRKKVKAARLVSLGVKKEYRKGILGALSVLLYVQMHRYGKELDYGSCELSWTLEDNDKINQGIQMMGAEHYKTYRVYEKLL